MAKLCAFMSFIALWNELGIILYNHGKEYNSIFKDNLFEIILILLFLAGAGYFTIILWPQKILLLMMICSLILKYSRGDREIKVNVGKNGVWLLFKLFLYIQGGLGITLMS